MAQNQVSGLQGAARFRIERELADTLQGRIYAGKDLITGKEVVIKEAWRQLVHSGRSRKGHRVPEDFVKERELIMTLTNLPNCTESIVRGIDQWDDEHCYYYAMEYCQGELFDHISKTHTDTEYRKFVESEANKEQIPMRKPNEWVNNVAKMFKQICNAVQFLHNHGYCHLDLSLENTMLSDVENLKVKIIDFGLMQKFTDNNFNFYGRVGKLQYMCPEAYARQEYDAKAADVYCLGVMLFMMLIGAPPYQAPQPQNAAFNYFVSGRIGDVLKHWKRLRLITVDALDLLNKILRYQNTRIKLDEILKHPFFDGIGDDGNKSQRSKPKIDTENKENAPNFLSPVDQISEEISGMSLEDDPNNQLTKPVKQITNASDEGVDMQISDGDEDWDVNAYNQIQAQQKLQQQQLQQQKQQKHHHHHQPQQFEQKENSNPNGPGSGPPPGTNIANIIHPAINSNNPGNNGGNNQINTYCELLLNQWELSEISDLLHATGWSTPSDWHQLDENILRWEVGLDQKQAQIFMTKYAQSFGNNKNENKQNAQKVQNTHQHTQKSVKPQIVQQMSMSPAPEPSGPSNHHNPGHGQYNNQPPQPSYNQPPNNQYQQHVQYQNPSNNNNNVNHNRNHNINQPYNNNNNNNHNNNNNMNPNANGFMDAQYLRQYNQTQAQYQQYMAQHLAQQTQRQHQVQYQQAPQYPSYNNNNNHINHSPSPQPAYTMPQPQMNVNHGQYAPNQNQYNASNYSQYNNNHQSHDPNRHNNNYKSAQQLHQNFVNLNYNQMPQRQNNKVCDVILRQ